MWVNFREKKYGFIFGLFKSLFIPYLFSLFSLYLPVIIRISERKKSHKILRMPHSRKLILAKCNIFDLTKISVYENEST